MKVALVVCAAAALVAAASAIPANHDLNKMTREQLARVFDIDLELDDRARAMTAARTPDSKVNAEEMGPYYQGDIIRHREPRNGVIDEDLFWPGGTVAYVIQENVFDQQAIDSINQALEEYSTLTGGCINWVPRTNEANYVFFTSLFGGCFSSVGMVGGGQLINYQAVAPGGPNLCTDAYGTTQHEMLHALGFYHEQSRTDRDDYVIIQEDNIEPGTENNFDKYGEDVISPYGEDYDYGSAMHYSAFAFSSNGLPTIIPYNPPGSEIGQRVHLSDVDVRKLMTMYGC